MVVEHGVDVLEEAGADVIGLGAELLLGDARPDHHVPGSFSRSMTRLTAIAARMFSGVPELWPSP